MYLLKSPKWLRSAVRRYQVLWEKPVQDELPSVYLTFDDGPHPKATPFVLDQLQMNQAKATFFCIGKNVIEQPEIYKRLLQNGHTVGNHTHNHFNGWKTSAFKYLKNVLSAQKYIDSIWFRPPYGRLTGKQALLLQQKGFKIVMWSLLSGDFDTKLTPEKCLQNVLKHLQPGHIVVFHDSEKAWPRLQYVLPRVLEYCRQQKWSVVAL